MWSKETRQRGEKDVRLHESRSHRLVLRHHSRSCQVVLTTQQLTYSKPEGKISPQSAMAESHIV